MFCLFFIAKNSAFAYRLTEKEVREIETLDHELCLSKGHNLATEYSIKFYWDCRLNLLNERIEESYKKGARYKFYTTELRRIKKVVKNILSRIESEFTDKMEYYTGKEDRAVELRGKDRYYYNLLSFLNFDYSLAKVNTRGEIRNIIVSREALAKQKKKDDIKKNLEKYPECIVYDIRSKEFAKCIEFKLQVEECKKSVLDKLNSRAVANKFTCKQQSIDKYPDHMALYNSEYQDLKNEKTDEYNINRKKQDEKEKRMAELNKLMSGPRLSNIQLINLRKFEEQKCLLDKELENNLFRLTVAGECENLLKNAKEEINNIRKNNKKQEE